jgi:hypothetical protein
MGRVSKYKKIKACDPFSKRNRGGPKGNAGAIDLSIVDVWGLGDDGRKQKRRSRTAEKLKAAKFKNKQSMNKNNYFFDLPPSEGDEFDLKDLIGSVKKQKLEPNSLLQNEQGKSTGAVSSTLSGDAIKNNNRADEESYNQVNTSTGNDVNIPVTDQDEAKVARLLKLENQITKKQDQKVLDSQKRMEGESKRAYAKRTKAETRQIIKQTSTKKNLEKLQRKKEFLNSKKKKKRGLALRPNDTFGDDYDDNGTRVSIITGERVDDAMAVDPVKFGEQAERPPIFRQLPRGANGKTSSSTNISNMNTKNSKGMSDEQISVENDAMEVMRRRVQAQYAAIRLKRRQAQESFHL